MKLINSSVEILSQKPGLQGIYEQIELAARTCYKSESNVKYDKEGNSLTAKDFVDKIVNVKKHVSVAEHGTVYLIINVGYNAGEFSHKRQIVNFFQDNPYSKVKWKASKRDDRSDDFFITTNYRVILEHYDYLKEDLQYLCEPTEYHERRVTVRVKCPISVSREWNRHRSLSISEQSTRYCNYSKDKFNNQITFCTPYWMKDIDKDIYEDAVKWFFQAIEEAEDAYLSIIDDGFKPQEAREVLPLCTATEVVYTGFVGDWKHFFGLRTAENAHPDIRKLALELQEQFKQKGLI